ncbi:hypothetical protein F4778DRAFT_600477 [Xylariomycetidae sp. FL2044]|nr:hypothetical protein F4778DRAFT_600477 [Xylariomycetidae sp. FL2044]
MEPGPPETKRPRLSTGTSWSSNHAVSLPHPTVAHLPQVSGPHHPASLSYQPQPPPPFTRPAEPSLPPPHHHPHDDRRHHDHEPYPPIQDLHRHPHPLSPAHPPYPHSHYAPRDPGVKRDPGEEPSIPHLRRPNSTGNVADGLPPAPHAHPLPNHQQPSDDQRRHMSFDSGAPMPHSPALYRMPAQNFHPPPTPVSQHPQYEGHVYGPPAPPMYPTLEIQAAASAKRKAQRASQACDSCRQLKAKCDETKPCKTCREKNIECKYRDPPAKQPDKVTADILDLLSAMKSEMSAGLQKMDKGLAKMDQRLTSVESSLKHFNPPAEMKVESIEGDGEHPDPLSSPVTTNRERPEEIASTPGGTITHRGPMTMDEADKTLREAQAEDFDEPPTGLVKPGKPAIPHNHTTLAGLLLTWPSINGLVQPHLDSERVHYPEDFPIRQETQRGILRVFGRGEGFDNEIRPVDKATPQDHSMTDINDDYSDVASPVPPGDVWGQVGSLAWPVTVDNKGGVINADGNPDWDPTKVWAYVDSFKKNILSMHPILIPRELDALVTLFLQSLPGKPASIYNQNMKSGHIAKFVNQPSTAVPPPFAESGTKRKRSPGGDEPNPSNPFQKPGRPYRSIHSALVLLVLALGKICLHRDKIPDAINDSDSLGHNSPLIRNGVLSSPSQGSPPAILSQSHSSGLPSPRESERIHMSRRPSFQGSMSMGRGVHAHRRNVDVIPGLEYFALATEIIGSHLGGCNLKHVYVYILAGLYHGQLGRVVESWSYISLASRQLQIILRPSLGRLSKLQPEGRVIESRRDNQLAFAFWTCLQLESDILAELPLPHSNLLLYEDRMPYPNFAQAVIAGYTEEVVYGYSAQLYLRMQLNKIHNLLYDSDKENEMVESMDDSSIEQIINDIQGGLKGTRHQWVPENYRWKDEDPPADNILAARLRAKYWGSQVILYRPFLKNFLERKGMPKGMYEKPFASPDSWNQFGIDPNSRNVQYARLGIQALEESTRAFHGIDNNQRLIITNVFGTAQAQWGNLLTLAACHTDPFLTNFVNKDTLSYLFDRTIKFFKTIAGGSGALKANMNILIGLSRDLNLTVGDSYTRANSSDIRANSSFSSMTSSHLPPIQASREPYGPHNSTTPVSAHPNHNRLPPLSHHQMP